MSRIRDIANILTAANALSTDVETAAAITSAINALPPGYGRGNTASRPASPTVGDIYVNTQTGFVEIYESTGWSQVGGIASTVTGVTATNSPSGRAYNNGAASIAFTPGTILGKTYTVTSSPGSFTASGSSSPITITGLQSSTQYTYTVVAANNYGTAAASSASSAVTATTVPQAPSITSVTGGNAQASVAFSANATGGSSITGYSVTSSPGGLTATGSSSPLVVTGLTNGTAYTFTAVATNANGSSAASSASSSVTPLALTITGGTLTSDSTYYYRTFTGSGNLVVSGESFNGDVLVIGGGGAGGYLYGRRRSRRSMLSI
jgi:large repetitive protein